MTLRQLEFLIGIADLGSLSACAEYFGVTQPAVTNQIRLLEEELSTALLIRGVRGATLTDSGYKACLQLARSSKRLNVYPLKNRSLAAVPANSQKVLTVEEVING